MTVLNQPHQIEAARLATLKAALKLEIKGMTRRGPSAYSILKGMGYKGTRESVLQQVENDVNKAIHG